MIYLEGSVNSSMQIGSSWDSFEKEMGTFISLNVEGIYCNEM